MTKEEVLKYIGRVGGWIALKNHPEYQNDREVVLVAVNGCGDALEYASEALKTDIDFCIQVFEIINTCYYFEGEVYDSPKMQLYLKLKGWYR